MSLRFVTIFVSLAFLLCGQFGLCRSSTCDRQYGICASPWKKLGGACYRTTPKPLTFDDARKACRKIGGKMAAPHSDQENDFMASLTPGTTLWVACTDRSHEGEWECERSQNRGQNYTNWANNQPDNHRGKEHCATIWGTSNKWNDARCQYRLYLAVCRRQPRARCFTTNNEGRLEADSCL